MHTPCIVQKSMFKMIQGSPLRVSLFLLGVMERFFFVFSWYKGVLDEFLSAHPELDLYEAADPERMVLFAL